MEDLPKHLPTYPTLDVHGIVEYLKKCGLHLNVGQLFSQYSSDGGNSVSYREWEESATRDVAEARPTIGPTCASSHRFESSQTSGGS